MNNKEATIKKLADIALVFTLIITITATLTNINMVKAAGTQITVPTDYPTIQAAINAAQNGDIIQLNAGTYNENISISGKPINITINGEDKTNTIIKGRIMILSSGQITINSMKVTQDINIRYPLAASPSLFLSNCILSNVVTNGLHDSVIENNIFEGNLTLSSDIRLPTYNNTVRSNTFLGSGVFLDGTGGSAMGCTDNRIVNNTISNAAIGIYEYGFGGSDPTGADAGSNLIMSNRITGSRIGIQSINSKTVRPRQTNISQNTLDSNINAITLSNVNTINIQQNIFTNNQYALTLIDTNNITIYQNNFGTNAHQTDIITGQNIRWNNDKEGNYWSDYNGTDIDQDGIGDTSYNISTNNTDYYPLMTPYGTSSNIAKPTSTPTASTAPSSTPPSMSTSTPLPQTPSQSPSPDLNVSPSPSVLPPTQSSQSANTQPSSSPSPYSTEIPAIPELNPLYLLVVLASISGLLVVLKRRKNT